jgi:hypothetical protein
MAKFSAGTCRLSHHAHKSTGLLANGVTSLFLFTAPGVGRRRDAMTASVRSWKSCSPAHPATSGVPEVGADLWVGRYLTFVNFPISVAVASDSGWAACLNSCKLAPCGTPRLSIRRAYTVNS